MNSFWQHPRGVLELSADVVLSMVVCGALGLAGLLRCGSLAAAEPAESAAQLQTQIEALQSKLQALTREEEKKGRVTEIGSSRGRPSDDAPARLIVKIYDLSDLFASAPNYPALEPSDLGGGLQPVFVTPAVAEGASGGISGGGFGGGLFAVQDKLSRPASVLQKEAAVLGQNEAGVSGATARTSMDTLIGAVTAAIDPESWDQVGGPGSITPLGTSLLVSASTETHQKLTTLLDLFRQRWGSLRTVTVQAWWLPLNDPQLLALASPEARAKTPWRQMVGEVPAAERYHAVTTCYNGQTVSAQCGSSRLLVTEIVPTVAEQAVSQTPKARPVHQGATLQVTPLVTRHAGFVVLDIHSRVNRIVPAAGKAEGAGALDRAEVFSQRLSTTLRLAIDQPALVGGLSYPDGKTLYLVVQASVQELRDDTAEGKPAGAAVTPPPPATATKPAAEK